MEIWRRRYIGKEVLSAIAEDYGLSRSRIEQIADRFEDERASNARTWLAAAEELLVRFGKLYGVPGRSYAFWAVTEDDLEATTLHRQG